MSLISDLIGSNQVSKAVNSQVNSLQTGINGINSAVSGAQTGVNTAVGNANDLLGSAYNTSTGALTTGYGAQTQALSPYMQAGAQGVTSLANAFAPGGSLTQQFNYTPSDLQNDPGYQFQLQQGQQAINRNASAKGQNLGGGTLAALSQFNQGLAGTTYNNAYQRALGTFQTNRNNQFQGLSTLAGVGQQAVGQFGQETGQYAQGIGNAANTFAQGAGNNLIGGATYSGNIGLQGADQTAQLNAAIGNARAGGSLSQGSIWGNYFGNTLPQGLGAAASMGAFG